MHHAAGRRQRGVNVLFTAALFTGTAAIGLWLHVRVPRLASLPFLWAFVGSAAGVELLGVVPVWTTSYPALYASIFGVLVPLLVAVWLGVLALLGSLRPMLR
jgi:hypothetical protein